MTFKLCDATCPEGFLHSRIGRIRQHDITPVFEFRGPLDRMQLDLAPDILGALAPFKLKNLNSQFFNYIFRHAQSGIFHIRLNNDASGTVIPLIEGIDAAFHLRRPGNLSVLEFRLRIHTADIFASYDYYPGYGRAYGHVFPINAGNIS